MRRCVSSPGVQAAVLLLAIASFATAASGQLRPLPEATSSATSSAAGSGPAPEGPKPLFVSSSAEVRFEDQALDSSSDPSVLTVTSTQQSEVVVSARTLPADSRFVVTPSACTIGPAGSCAFRVRFQPKQAGVNTGTLTLTDDAGGSRAIRLSGQGVGCYRMGPCRLRNAFPLLFAVVLIYEAALIAVRWHMIARPTRSLLSAQLEALQSQVNSVKALNTDEVHRIRPVEDLLGKAWEQIVDSGWSSWLDVLFWSRGGEIAGWGLAHEAEAQLGPFLSYNETRAGLERAAADLLQLADSTAISIAEHIRQALTVAHGGAGGASEKRLQALLQQARRMLYDASDTRFATMVSWQNKAAWLVGVGLVLILALAADLGNEDLFLLGAAGGLLSRLSRALNRADVPTDYGASWTTLFLSPVVGALSAWCGILVVAAAFKLQLLGAAFASVTGYDSYSPMVFGVAILLGFSERAFDGILTQLEAAVVPAGETPSPTALPSSGAVPLRILPPTLLPAKVGIAYSASLQAQGGTAPYRWSIAAGNLPAGLQLTGAALNGTPTLQGTYAFTLQITDVVGSAATSTLTLEVTAA